MEPLRGADFAAATSPAASPAAGTAVKHFNPNDLFDVVRAVAGDLVEEVRLVDEFARGERRSLCYRFSYRAVDRTLRQAEVNELHEEIARRLETQFGVQVRRPGAST